MTLILDAGPLVALADRHDRLHQKVVDLLSEEPGALVLPAPVSAEADYIIGKRLGPGARRAFIEDLAAMRFDVGCLDPTDYSTVAQLDSIYRDLELGLSDAAIVVLAARFETTRIASFDDRHFRTVRPLQGGTFSLLPADS